MKRRPAPLLGSSIFVLFATSLAHAASYSVVSVTATDLGTLGGDQSYAADINNRGDIVGFAKNASMKRLAVRWHGGVILDLGTPASSAFSYADGINDVGEIVGKFGDPSEFEYRPFYWTLGTGMVEMDRSLFPGDPLDKLYVGMAHAINNKGMIVGDINKDFTTFSVPCRKSLPVAWDNAYAAPYILHCAEDIGSYNHASDVNDSGWVVGSEGDGAGPIYGFVWKSGVTTHIPNPFLGVEVHASGINEGGLVVGSAKMLGVATRAILWDGVSASSTWLPVLTGGSMSYATEIDDQSFVAGTSDTVIKDRVLPSQVRDRAFLWHSALGMYPLPVPPGYVALTTDCSGTSLNNWISSTGVVKVVGTCGKHAVLWTVVVKKVP